MRQAPVLPLFALFAFVHCSPQSPSPGVRVATPTPSPSLAPADPIRPKPPAPAAEAPAPSAHEGDTRPSFGGPAVIDRVAIYPITLAAQEEIGPVIPLDEALARGSAEVREVGAEGAGAPEAAINPPAPTGRDARREQRRERGALPEQRPQEGEPAVQQRQLGEGGATVNTLVIENKGDVPIFVLAGTVVKGGKQDRQIGQDFIVQARQTLPVDAFCVEQGRWNAERQGALTGGRFAAAPVLATSKVRAAGQYKKNQQEVWSEVAKTNGAHQKSADSGTLLATLDDADVARRMDALSDRIEGALAAVTPAEHLVGFAWAIDGRIQGVRWFAHRSLFAIARSQLVKTAAVDALTAEAGGAAAPEVKVPAATEVAAFVTDIEAQTAVEKRTTEGANDNEYRESERGWGAKTVLKAQAGKKERAVAFDYLAK